MPSIHAVTVGNTTYDIEGNIKVVPLYYKPTFLTDQYDIEYSGTTVSGYKLYQSFSTASGPSNPLTEIESNTVYRISSCLAVLNNRWTLNITSSKLLIGNDDYMFPLDYEQVGFDPVSNSFAKISSSDSNVIAFHAGEDIAYLSSDIYVIKMDYSATPERYRVYVDGDVFDTVNSDFLNQLQQHPEKFNFYLDFDPPLIKSSSITVDADLNVLIMFDISSEYMAYQFLIDSSGNLLFNEEFDYYPEVPEVYVDGSILYM